MARADGRRGRTAASQRLRARDVVLIVCVKFGADQTSSISREAATGGGGSRRRKVEEEIVRVRERERGEG